MKTMEKIEFGEWQLCPKCNGQGTVSKPHHVAGDVNTWTANATSFRCDVCQGAKILARPILDPPIVFDKAKPSEEEMRIILEDLRKQPIVFKNNEEEIVEKWSDKIIKDVKEKMLVDIENWFSFTHYSWMYRSTGNKKYFKLAQEAAEKNGR